MKRCSKCEERRKRLKALAVKLKPAFIKKGKAK